jgi:Flp pilus assembly protein TadG
MRAPLRGMVQSESGTSLIEFAIIAPLLIFLLIGLIEVGRYTYFAIVIANAARAGVSYGSQNTSTAQDTTGMQTAALADATSIPQVSASPTYFCANSSTSTPTPTACPASGPTPPVYYYVEVTTSGTFKSLLHYPGIPNNVPITSTAVMRVVDTTE